MKKQCNRNKLKTKACKRESLIHRVQSLSEICFQICATRKRRVIFSIVSAFVIFWLCYFMDNSEPFAALDRSDLCYFIEKTLPEHSRRDFYDSVFFVNTSRDRQIVCLNTPLDTSLYQVGNTDITDRKMLLDFLNMMDTVDYKFLIIDLTFDKRHKTEYDKALFDKMLKMRNIIIADKVDTINCYEIADKRLQRIARLSDYNSYFGDQSFSRYAFLQKKEHSIPMEINYRLFGKDIHKLFFLPIYYSKAHLCMNAPKLRIHGEFKRGELKVDPNVCGDLGFSFVNADKRDLNADLSGKYVIVTDISQDVHDTYLGKAPGGYIVYEALRFLENDHHVLKWRHVFLTILVFSLVLLFLFWTHYGMPFDALSKKKSRLSAVVKWLVTNGILYLFYLIVYLKFSFIYNIVIPMTYVTIVAFVISKSKQYEKNLSNSNPAAVA